MSKMNIYTQKDVNIYNDQFIIRNNKLTYSYKKLQRPTSSSRIVIKQQPSASQLPQSLVNYSNSNGHSNSARVGSTSQQPYSSQNNPQNNSGKDSKNLQRANSNLSSNNNQNSKINESFSKVKLGFSRQNHRKHYQSERCLSHLNHLVQQQFENQNEQIYSNSQLQQHQQQLSYQQPVGLDQQTNLSNNQKINNAISGSGSTGQLLIKQLSRQQIMILRSNNKHQQAHLMKQNDAYSQKPQIKRLGTNRSGVQESPIKEPKKFMRNQKQYSQVSSMKKLQCYNPIDTTSQESREKYQDNSRNLRKYSKASLSFGRLPSNFSVQSSAQNLPQMPSKQEIQIQKLQNLKQARGKLSSQNYEEAISILDNITDCKTARYLQGLAMLDFQDKNTIDDAKKQFEMSLNEQHLQLQGLGKQGILGPEPYLMLANCERSMGYHQRAFALIEECIKKYTSLITKNTEVNDVVYFYKAQYLYERQKFKQALEAYKHCVIDNSAVKLGKADCLRQLNRNKEALVILDKELENQSSELTTELKTIWRMRKVESLLQLHHYEACMSVLQLLLADDPENLKAHYYMGKVLSKNVENNLSKNQDVLLHLQKAAQTEDAQLLVNTLYLIAKVELKIKQYGNANRMLEEGSDLPTTTKRIQVLREFTEAVYDLQKRKIKKSIQDFSDLLEILQEDDPIAIMALSQRVYAYAAIEKYEQALVDVKKIKKSKFKLGHSTRYNKYLARGILAMDHEEYLMASKYFNKASSIFPQNKDAYCLNVISIVQSFSYALLGFNIDEQQKYDKIMQTKLFMDKAIEWCCLMPIMGQPSKSEPSLYFFRGLLHFYLHNFYFSIQDFSQAIKSDCDLNPMYHLARGRAYSCIGMMKQAQRDLSVAIKVDDQMEQAYRYRGMCNYLLGDTNTAFSDFQRAIICDPQNPNVHVQAGNMLMTTGAYEDALKAFQNADTISKTAQSLFQQTRCYCALNQLDKALSLLHKLLDKYARDVLVKYDFQILKQLIMIANASKDLQNNGQTQQSKSSLGKNNNNNANTTVNKVEKAQETLSKAILFFTEMIDKLDIEKIEALKIKDTPVSQKLIPALNRIKIEKSQLARDNIMCKIESQESSSNEGDESITLDQGAEQLDEIEKYPHWQKYRENIFSQSDLILFRAVSYFYLQKYDQAIVDFEVLRDHNNHGCQSELMKSSVKQSLDPMPSQKLDSQLNQDNMSMNSDMTDLSEIGLTSLNVYEKQCNILICALLMGNQQKCQTVLKEMFSNKALKQKHVKHMQQMESTVDNFFKKGSLGCDWLPDIMPDSRLCSKFAPFQVTCNPKKGETNGSSNSSSFLVKLSFSMPFIRPPNMIPSVDEAAIQAEFSLKQIDAPVPEAPWLNHCYKVTDYKTQTEDATTIRFFVKPEDDNTTTPKTDKSPNKSKPQSQQSPAKSPVIKPQAETQTQNGYGELEDLKQKFGKTFIRDLDEAILSESDVEMVDEFCSHEECQPLYAMQQYRNAVNGNADLVVNGAKSNEFSAFDSQMHNHADDDTTSDDNSQGENTDNFGSTEKKSPNKQPAFDQDSQLQSNLGSSVCDAESLVNLKAPPQQKAVQKPQQIQKLKQNLLQNQKLVHKKLLQVNPTDQQQQQQSPSKPIATTNIGGQNKRYERKNLDDDDLQISLVQSESDKEEIGQMTTKQPLKNAMVNAGSPDMKKQQQVTKKSSLGRLNVLANAQNAQQQIKSGKNAGIITSNAPIKSKDKRGESSKNRSKLDLGFLSDDL